MAPSKLSDSDKQQMAQFYCQPGETTSTLANKFGVSSSTVSRVLKQQLSEEDYARLMQWKRSGERGSLDIEFGAVDSPSVPQASLSEAAAEESAETASSKDEMTSETPSEATDEVTVEAAAVNEAAAANEDLGEATPPETSAEMVEAVAVEAATVDEEDAAIADATADKDPDDGALEAASEPLEVADEAVAADDVEDAGHQPELASPMPGSVESETAVLDEAETILPAPGEHSASEDISVDTPEASTEAVSEESSLDTEIPEAESEGAETASATAPILSRRSRQRSRTAASPGEDKPTEEGAESAESAESADSVDQLPLQLEVPSPSAPVIPTSDRLSAPANPLDNLDSEVDERDERDDREIDDDADDTLSADWEDDTALHDPDGSDDYEDDYDDDELAEEDEEDWEEVPVQAPVPSKRLKEQLEILPLDMLRLKRPCYLVIDRLSELITCPLKDFSELGLIPKSEEQARTLPVFDNHRVARRFSRRNQRIVKVPDGKLLTKTQQYLHAKGITRILFDGHVYALN